MEKQRILGKNPDDRIYCGEKLELNTSVYDPEEGKVILFALLVLIHSVLHNC